MARESHLSSGLAGRFPFNITKRLHLYGCYSTGCNTRKPLDFCTRANHHRQKEQRTSVLAPALPAWTSHQMVGRRKAAFQLASRAERNFSVTAELCFAVFQQRAGCQGVTRCHPVLTQSSRGCSIPSSGWSHPCWLPACSNGDGNVLCYKYRDNK